MKRYIKNVAYDHKDIINLTNHYIAESYLQNTDKAKKAQKDIETFFSGYKFDKKAKMLMESDNVILKEGAEKSDISGTNKGDKK